MDIAKQRARLNEAIENGELLHVEMGTATTMDGDEVPWRAMIRPLAFVKSSNGERLRCEVRADDLYWFVDAAQSEGVKHWPLGSFTIIE